MKEKSKKEERMKELKNVKDVLRDVLSFAKRLNPDCRPMAIIGTDDDIIQIEIRKMNYRDIPDFVAYFSCLTGEIKSWATGSSFDLHIEFNQDSQNPDLNNIKNFFCFGAKEVRPILIKILMEGRGGSITEKRKFYPLEDLILD